MSFSVEIVETPSVSFPLETGFTDWSQIANKPDVLTTAVAAATYLTQANAATYYLTQSVAAGTYLSQAGAASIYLSKSSASSTYAPLTGTGASGTWGISISGNAATASTTSALGASATGSNLSLSAVSAALSLTSSTSAWIAWAGSTGLGAPTYTTRSIGTKLLLYPVLDATHADYAIGIDNYTFWQTVPNSASSFKWYAGTSVIATLDGALGLNIPNSIGIGTSPSFHPLDISSGGTYSQIRAKNSGGSSFTVAPLTDGGVYIGFGLKYASSAWVHDNVTTYNGLMVINGASGAGWFASNNSTSSFNVAYGVALWNQVGQWYGGFNGSAAGGLPYATGANTSSVVEIGAANAVLTSSGTAPQWSTALLGLTSIGLASGTLTGASSPFLNATQTWNNAATTFTGALVNVTDTASAAASLLLDLQVGGVSRASISKAGAFTCTAQTFVGTNPTFTVSGTLLFNQDYSLGARAGGLFVVNSAGAYTWSGTTAYNTTPDTYLYRDASGTLAQRNSANAQGFRVYNTYTDASNYERAAMYWSGNQLYIGSEKAGTGTARVVNIGSNPAGAPDAQLILQGTTVRIYAATSYFGLDSNSNPFPGTSSGTLGVIGTPWNALYLKTSAQIIGAASKFEVWNTAYDATNYEKGVFDWVTTANTLTIGTIKGGTGTARAVNIVSGNDISLQANGAGPTIKAANGNFQPNSSSNPALTGNFICITATAGAPSSTPTGTLGNSTPIHFDTTGKKLYVWDPVATAWKSTAALT